MELQPFQQRVVTEKTELDDKIEKLTAFTNGDHFSKLSREEQHRMHRQLVYMTSYSGVLGERIAAFQ